MRWVYEVSFYHYLGEEDYLVMYQQFSKADEAFEYARSLLDGLLPTVIAEVKIKVTPQD